MKIKINKGVNVCGPDINLTDYRVIYSVNDVLARSLITAGKAVEVVESKTIKAAEDTPISSAQEIPEEPVPAVEEVHPIATSRKKFNPRDHK